MFKMLLVWRNPGEGDSVGTHSTYIMIFFFNIIRSSFCHMMKANLRTAQTSKDNYKLHVYNPHIKTASDGLNNLLPVRRDLAQSCSNPGLYAKDQVSFDTKISVTCTFPIGKSSNSTLLGLF